MTPELQPDVPLLEVLIYGVLNPATIVVAFLMGRRVDAKNKILLAAFIGAAAGSLLLYIATFFQIWDAPTLGRSIAGTFIVSLIAGYVYAAAGYWSKR